MKAAFVKRYNKVKILDVEKPRPANREVLIRIDACGVCGSDYIEAKAWARKWKRFGHEIAATVAETGDEVTGLTVGDQVVVALSIPCGSCAPCIKKNPRTCKHLITAEQGGFAEYLLVKDYRLLSKVEPPLPAALACLAEPLTVILDAFHLAELRKDDNLLIVGGGNIGKLASLTAKVFGANVVGLVSRKLSPGISACINETGGDFFPWRTMAGWTIGLPDTLVKGLEVLTGRVVILHTAPSSYLSRYLYALPYNSIIINIGLSASNSENRMKLDGFKMITKRLQLLSSFPVPCMYMASAVKMLQNHPALFTLLSTKEIHLKQLPELIKNAGKFRDKVIVRPHSQSEIGFKDTQSIRNRLPQ